MGVSPKDSNSEWLIETTKIGIKPGNSDVSLSRFIHSTKLERYETGMVKRV
jgi:hypothetical protein